HALFTLSFHHMSPTCISALSLHDALPIWSFVNGGPSIVLEYGIVSCSVADGMLRLFSELDIVASLRVGRGVKFTCDTYWIRISGDRKSTRLNSSHGSISYAVFCLKKKRTA